MDNVFLTVKDSFTESLRLKVQRLINTFNERLFKDFQKGSCWVQEKHQELKNNSSNYWVMHHNNASSQW